MSNHGETWRTIHRRRCINYYGTGWWVWWVWCSRFRNNFCKDDRALFSRFLRVSIRRGIIVYREDQSFWRFVRMGPPTPYTASECGSPPPPLRGKDPISTTVQKLWYSIYTIIPLRVHTVHCPTISLTFIDPVRNTTEDDPLLPVPTEEQGLAGARQPVSQAGQSHS